MSIKKLLLSILFLFFGYNSIITMQPTTSTSGWWNFYSPSQQTAQSQTPAVQQAPALSDYDFNSASVLPFYTAKDNVTYCILAEEAHGRDANTWDDFSGKRDPNENHPLVTAAREFLEEANIDVTVPSKPTVRQVEQHIDLDNGKTAYIIADTHHSGNKNVTYITNVASWMPGLVTNFYTAIDKATEPERKEKKTIAIVRWENFIAAIQNSSSNTDVQVAATVINRDGSQTNKNIPLRGYLAAKLRKFITNQPYTAGKDSKIRFYQ